ncbi:MAG TPA: CoA transferase [Rhizobiaceae bacterium]|nr:CoA transferase [Rhizobiaceae bacterium]
MGPLNGIRILDLTTVVMGPFATTILGDLGADVIKLESPEGDIVRRVGPSRSGEMGGLFMHSNRSKRSIAIDLKTKRGRQLALDLAASVDVLVYNIRPAAMERLGLAFEDLKAVNPDIIYVGALGFGRGGSYFNNPAYDDLIQGLCAVPALIAEASGSAPRYAPVNIADRMVGLYASNAILAAILHRNATGEGQQIDIPMFETMASIVLADHLGGLSFIPPLDAGGYGRLLSRSRLPYRTADGHICIMLYTQRHRECFAALLEKLGVEHRHLNEARGTESDYMASIFSKRTTNEWEYLLRSCDVPHARLHTIETLLDDPHLAEVGFFKRAEHASEGVVVSMEVPSKWSRSAPNPIRSAPRLGQHSREVMREIGIDEQTMDELIADAIVVETATGPDA